MNTMLKKSVWGGGLVLLGMSLHAADDLWNAGASGNWSVNGNWTDGSAPGAGDVPIVRDGSTVTWDAAASATAQALAIGRDGTGTLTVAGNRTVSTYSLIGTGTGANGVGTLNVNSGTLTINGGWQHWGSAATYTGQSVGVTGNSNGTAFINVNGGNITAPNTATRNNVGMTEGGGNIGSGAGTMTLNSGTVYFGGSYNLGMDQNGTGNGNAVGILHQNGGSLTVNRWVTVGWQNDGVGTYNHAAGTLDILGNDALHVGADGNAQGTYNLSGTGVANVGRIISGRSGGDATFNITGGTLTSRNFTNFGQGSPGGTAVVNHSAGTVNLNGGWSQIAESNGSSATYNLSGGNLNVNSTYWTVGTRGDGFMEVSGTGQLDVAGQMWVGRSHEGQFNNGTFIVSGGQAMINSLNVGNSNGAATVTLDGGILGANSIAVSTGDVFNWGEGTLTTRSNGAEGGVDYTSAGFNTVRAGTILDVTGTDLDTGFNFGNSTLDLGGTFINNGVRFNQLTLTGELDLSAGGDVLRSIDNPYPLRPNVGTAIESGSLVLVEAAGGIVSEFDTFVEPSQDNIGWSEFTGVFTTAAALPVNTWYLEYTGDLGGGLEQIIFHYKVEGTVPEPGTMGLALLGVVLFRGMRDRRRKSRS